MNDLRYRHRETKPLVYRALNESPSLCSINFMNGGESPNETLESTSSARTV